MKKCYHKQQEIEALENAERKLLLLQSSVIIIGQLQLLVYLLIPSCSQLQMT